MKVKSCNALLCMLLVCIHSYLKQVLTYKLLNTYHPVTLFLQQGCEDLCLFLQAKRCVSAKKSGKHQCRVKYSKPKQTHVSMKFSTCTPCSTSPTKVKMQYMCIWILLYYDGVCSTVISTFILLTITIISINLSFRTKWMYSHVKFGFLLHLVRQIQPRMVKHKPQRQHINLSSPINHFFHIFLPPVSSCCINDNQIFGLQS